MMKRALAALAVVAAVAATPVAAEQYPDRPVTIVVPFPAGGPTDETARQIANGLGTRLKGNFIVQNISGGGANIGSNHVAHAAPDGYTLLLHNLAISANVTLFKDLPFDTEKDLRPVMFVNRNPLVLVGRKTLPPNGLAELLTWMKTNHAKFAVPGYGTTAHLATTMFGQEAKVTFDIIPYRGGTPVMTDLLGDHVDLFFGTPQQVGPQVLAGKLKLYGISTDEKLAQLPNADSVPKLLGPKLNLEYWQALYAPSGTPDAIVKTLNSTLEQVVSDPALLKIWEGEGVSPFPKDKRSPEAGAALMKSEIARWGEVIRANNIHIEN
jgi:tripartite-type tricarboxylate transporter receptor subunit TctC